MKQSTPAPLTTAPATPASFINHPSGAYTRINYCNVTIECSTDHIAVYQNTFCAISRNVSYTNISTHSGCIVEQCCSARLNWNSLARDVSAHAVDAASNKSALLYTLQFLEVRFYFLLKFFHIWRPQETQFICRTQYICSWYVCTLNLFCTVPSQPP